MKFHACFPQTNDFRLSALSEIFVFFVIQIRSLSTFFAGNLFLTEPSHPPIASLIDVMFHSKQELKKNS